MVFLDNIGSKSLFLLLHSVYFSSVMQSIPMIMCYVQMQCADGEAGQMRPQNSSYRRVCLVCGEHLFSPKISCEITSTAP